MDYFKTLTAEQKSNINFIIKRMGEKGINNSFTKSAILAIASKESGFIPHSEASYSHTLNERIRQIFGHRVAMYDEAGLTALKAKDVDFFNVVYGLAKFGQTTNEGYKYRGRGLNQITFKENYRRLGDKIGVDLVDNPDKLNELPVAADALIQFFLDGFHSAPKDKLAQYNATDINSFKNTKDSIGAVYNANSGWSTPKSTIDSDPTGGRAKAESRVDGFLAMVEATV